MSATGNLTYCYCTLLLDAFPVAVSRASTDLRCLKGWKVQCSRSFSYRTSSAERSVLTGPFWYSLYFRVCSNCFHFGSSSVSFPTPTIFMVAILLILGSKVQSLISETSFCSRICFRAASFFYDFEARMELCRFCDKLGPRLNSLSFDLLAILFV